MKKSLQALVLTGVSAIFLTGCASMDVLQNFYKLGQNKEQIRQEDKYEKTYNFPDSGCTNRYEVAKARENYSEQK